MYFIPKFYGIENEGRELTKGARKAILDIAEIAMKYLDGRRTDEYRVFICSEVNREHMNFILCSKYSVVLLNTLVVKTTEVLNSDGLNIVSAFNKTCRMAEMGTPGFMDLFELTFVERSGNTFPECKGNENIRRLFKYVDSNDSDTNECSIEIPGKFSVHSVLNCADNESLRFRVSLIRWDNTKAGDIKFILGKSNSFVSKYTEYQKCVTDTLLRILYLSTDEKKFFGVEDL